MLSYQMIILIVFIKNDNHFGIGNNDNNNNNNNNSNNNNINNNSNNDNNNNEAKPVKTGKVKRRSNALTEIR